MQEIEVKVQEVSKHQLLVLRSQLHRLIDYLALH